MRIYGLKKIHFKPKDEKNAYSIACFFSFHRYLENNKINSLDSGAFNNLPELWELYVYLIMYLGTTATVCV